MTRQEFKEALVGKYLVTRTPSGAMTRGKVKDIFFTPVATTANVVQVRDDGKEFSTYIEEEDLEELVKEGECIRWNTKRLSTLYVIESEAKAMKKDLMASTLVMCKAHESELDGWRLQHYWQKGQTLTSMGSETIHSGWLYIVPLRYFKPTSTDWRPAESCNWANFGEEAE